MEKNKKTKPEKIFPGYPPYPSSEDIFKKGIKEGDLDPEDITRKKLDNENPGTWNEKNFDNEMTGEDLDVPGTELDDVEEDIGSEDEENNYYSIGGDDHENLEEDQGD